MKGVYTETRWQIFKHRFGIMPRMCFMHRYKPYNNFISNLLWRFWFPNRK